MIFRTFGSGSSGNSHTLTSSTGCTLVLDAGVKEKAIFSVCKPSSIAAVLITHKHGDHALYGEKYAKNFIDVYAPMDKAWCKTIKHGDTYTLGEFKVKVLQMRHDVPCVGFLIRHKEMYGDILYATDTDGIPYKFGSISIAVIEADYFKPMLVRNVRKGVVPPSVAERIECTHQSLSQAIRFLSNNIKKVYSTVLVHLSSDNANEELFVDRTEKHTNTPVYVAKKGFVLEFNKYSMFDVGK